MESTEVSIIIPAYNAEDFIDETLNAALSAATHTQSVSSELIIIDDGSTDDTYEKIVSFANKHKNRRIKYEKQENKGPASAANYGVSLASGSYITFCDHDDLLAPTSISALRKLLNTYDFAIGEKEGFKIRDKKILKTYSKTTSKRHLLKSISKKKQDHYLLHANIASLPFMILKKSFKEIGGYNESFEIAHDYDLALRLIYQGKVVPPGFTNEVLYYRRELKFSQSHLHKQRQIIEAEIAINSALQRIGFHNRKAVYKGKDSTGYLYFNHATSKKFQKV